MSKYKKLYETYKSTLDENVKLKKDLKVLEGQRRALVKELDEKEKQLAEKIKLDNEIGNVVTALSVNLTKSLMTKNIINMKPDEKDAVYYMLERFGKLIGVINNEK